jgi:cytochrome c553
MILRRNRTVMLAALAGFGATSLLCAENASRPADPKHGAVIAAQGTAAGAPACAGCHAFNGSSDASGAFPRIARQSAVYLASQLHDFASGVRASAVMSQVARRLSSDDIADVAAFYARVDAPLLPLKAGDSALIKRGERLATVGSAEKQIPGCNNCHGPGGAGEPPSIPYLAGQYGSYITSTLHLWQQGYRQNNPQGMGLIARSLDDQDIAAVSAYYQHMQSSRVGNTKAY